MRTSSNTNSNNLVNTTSAQDINGIKTFTNKIIGNDVTQSNLVTGSDGNATTPSITFNANTDTGFYKASINTIGIATGGTQRAIVDNNGLEIIDGNNTNPSISFINDIDTGIYRVTANTIAITTGGTERLRIDGSGNVGIGKTPSVPLDVNGNTSITGTLGVSGVTTISNILNVTGNSNLGDGSSDTTTVLGQLVIPTSAPASPVNGAIWIT